MCIIISHHHHIVVIVIIIIIIIIITIVIIIIIIIWPTRKTAANLNKNKPFQTTQAPKALAVHYKKRKRR